MRVIYLFLCLSLTSCIIFDAPEKKIFIKSVKSKDLVIDWYIYSLISSFSPAKIQIEKDKHIYQVVEYGHGITDISVSNNILTIQTSRKPAFVVDKDVLEKVGLAIRFDTTGQYWNESTPRVGRLQGKQVDFTKRHFVDSYGTSFGN